MRLNLPERRSRFGETAVRHFGARIKIDFEFHFDVNNELRSRPGTLHRLWGMCADLSARNLGDGRCRQPSRRGRETRAAAPEHG